MSARAALFASAACAITAGCNFAPKYTRPSTPATAAYREVTPADYKSMDGWKVAQPQDDRIRGKWWQMFGDPLLNQLEDQVDASNQTLVQAYANYRAARAVLAGARSQFFPPVIASPDITRHRSGSTSFRSSANPTVVPASGTTTSYQVPASATWEMD